MTNPENLENLTYVAGLKEGLAEANKLQGEGYSDVWLKIIRHQDIPTSDGATPNTLYVDSKVHIDGQGCRLNGQLNFRTGSTGSTVENSRFWLEKPNETTANIIADVPVTVTNNDFRLPPASTQFNLTNAGPANSKRPVGVQVSAGTGSTIKNNVFEAGSADGTDTNEEPHNQDQGVRLSGTSAGTVVSNNTFNVPVGVSLAQFKGTGTIENNTFSGKYAVADTWASDPSGLTYLGKTIEYGADQDVNTNVLGKNTLSYRGVFAGDRKNNSGKFQGTSYGVRYLNAKDDSVLGWDAVKGNTTPTRIPTRTGFQKGELYTDKATTQLLTAADMTNNRDGLGPDVVTDPSNKQVNASTDLGAVYVKWYKNVKFSVNDGSGTAPGTQKVYEDGKIDSLPDSNGMTAPAGKSRFLGWSTDAKATEDDFKAGKTGTFKAGEAFTPAADSAAEITLYAIWAPAQVNVTYELGDGGQGTAPTQDPVNEDSEIAVKSGAGLTNTDADLKFGGWKSSLDGKVYQENDKLNVGKTGVTLTAQWVAKTKYTVSYHPNGGTGSIASVTVNEGDEVTLPESTALTAPDGKKFGGWMLAADGQKADYQPGDKVKVNDHMTLYAFWIDMNKVTVSYNANGGSGSVPSTVVYENSEAVLAEGKGFTAPDGKKFGGWMKDAKGTKADYQPGDKLKVGTADVTLYAYWAPAPKPATPTPNG
ncbi:hypothetical protein DF200_10365, partial [Bifidobacterium catulorum]